MTETYIPNRPYRSLVRVSELSQDVKHDDAYHEDTFGLVEEVCKALRCEWGVVTGREFGRVYFYHPDEVFAMGHIRVSKEYDNNSDIYTQYVVGSRNIRNRQHSEYTNDHYKKKTKNIATAIRNAKRYITPLTPNELMVATYANANNSREVYEDRHTQTMLDACKALGVTTRDRDPTTSMAFMQLRQIRDTGHDSLTAECTAHMEEVEKAYALLSESKRSGFKMFYVHNDKVWARDASSGYCVQWEDNVDVCNVDELDRESMEKIAMLNVMSNGTYDANLGYKDESGKIFYVKQ